MEAIMEKVLFQERVMKQETKVALPMSSIVRLLVDHYFDDTPLKFEVFFLSSADADT